MAQPTSQKQQKREHIVGIYLRDAGYDVEKAEAFDVVLCGALGIDADKHPPLFIADLVLLG
jgi:hypothetical protein